MATAKQKTPQTPQQPFTEEALFPRVSLKNWKVMLPLLAVLIALVWLGFRFNVDDRVVVGGAVLFGVLSSLFAWIVGVLGLIPVIGPLIVKVLAIPIIWLLNALGYLVSFIAIKRGYSRDVLTYRGLTIALIVGIIIGFILGHLI
ncbi:MAG: hypothetical protein ACAH09_02250 [Methylophilaceae bacterium]|jgi:hypothetical protein